MLVCQHTNYINCVYIYENFIHVRGKRKKKEGGACSELYSLNSNMLVKLSPNAGPVTYYSVFLFFYF